MTAVLHAGPAAPWPLAWRILLGAARTLNRGFALLLLFSLLIEIYRPSGRLLLWFGAWIVHPLGLALLALWSLGVLLEMLCRVPRWYRRLLIIFHVVLAVGTLVDSVGFWRAYGGGQFASNLPVPLSLLLTVVLLSAAFSMSRLPQQPPGWLAIGRRCAFSVLMIPLFFLAQIIAIGSTDYSRPADVIVILGAGVRPDDTPSNALRDRLVQANVLYQQGLAPMVLCTGGENETPVMQATLEKMGVPAAAIVCDPAGNNTAASAVNLAELAPRYGWRRALAVSHGYHLARIRLLALQVGGECTVVTVPAPQQQVLQRLPFYVAREVVAYGWAYAGLARPKE